MAVKSNINDLTARIQNRIQKLKPGNDELRKAFTRIGILISSDAKLNVRKHGLIDTGRLINSLRYELKQNGDNLRLIIGSFGVPYAAVHEFGYKGNVNISGHRRLMVQAFGKPVDQREIEVRPHSRFMNIRQRPFLRPAVRKHASTAIDIIREVMRNG